MKIRKMVVHLSLPQSLGERILAALEANLNLGERLMTTVAEIQATLDSVAAAAAAEKEEVTAALNALSAQIADLQTAIANGAGVTAADLDTLQASATALVAQVQQIKE